MGTFGVVGGEGRAAGRRLLLGGLPALIAVVALLVPQPARGQYFGRNKVQYRGFDFQVLRTQHFDLYVYPEERPAAEMVARMAERWYARLSAVFDHQLTGRQPVILYGSHPEFEQTNAISGELSEATGGVTEVLKRRIVLPMAGPLAETDHVLGHELVHAFQYDITGSGGGTLRGGGVPGAALLPLWFIEGMAEYFSVGPEDPNTAMWLRDAVRHQLPTVRDLEGNRFFPYRYGQALLAYIGGRWGDGALTLLLRAGSPSGDLNAAIGNVLGLTPAELSKQWHTALRDHYAWFDSVTAGGDRFGTLVPTGKGEPDELSLAPAVSPDGRQVVYLSARGLFSIDLYLADAESGAIVRRLTNTARDPHFQGLEFIGSAGAWDATGRRIAFSAISRGRPVLEVFDVKEGRVEREIRLPALGEVLNPTWSPRGDAIAFAALVGGLTDLYLYDLGHGELHKLTDDPYADLQPAWSPDGREIAFATDRFSTSLDGLETGNIRLALLDVATGAVRPVVGADSGKNINPAWAPGGTALYFVSDRAGISDIYRVELSSGSVSQVTRLYTGVSGITGLSPVLSVAAQTGRLLCSVYDNSGYRIYRLDDSRVLAGQPPSRPTGVPNPAMLPPENRQSDALVAGLRNMSLGLPPSESPPVSPYRSRLALDYVAQPTVVAGIDRFGSYIGGGAALFFSDLLGDHNLVTGLQVNGSLKDLAALVGYSNLAHRVNWGLIGQQVPYRTGGFFAGPGEVNGDTLFLEQELIVRETDREVGGFLSYPFNQAQRLEFSGSYANISFSRELHTLGFSYTTGNLVYEDRRDLSAPSAINLVQPSLALVYDNAVLGATTPVLGQRYRLEATPTFGSLTMVNVLADYRRYIMVHRPFTLAGRLLHYGRYGKSSDDTRLSPLFLGYEGLVRGYGFYSFSADECHPPAGNPNACPVFDQLQGSRMVVGNVEFRFPLLGVLGVGSGYYGGFPLEFALFGDGGVAWQKGEKPSFLGGDRKPVFSTGAALRVSFYGALLLELDLTHPFDRPGKNWVWQFNIVPGF